MILNKTYIFNLSENDIRIGPLSFDKICKRFRSGHVGGHFVEDFLEAWFPELTKISGCEKGYDFLHKDGRMYECKSFTKYGANLAPSFMVGSGRKYNKELHKEMSAKIVYAICDITTFPKVKVKFIEGEKAFRKYGKKITPSKKGDFFSD